MREVGTLAVFAALSMSCGGSTTRGVEPVSARPTPVLSSVAPSAQPAASPSPAAAEPSAVRVLGHPHDGVVDIEVTNAGAANVTLGKELIVEQEQGGHFVALATSGFTLRDSCDVAPADACRTLVPGATLLPPAWLGTIGDAQCGCERCVRVPAGRYRFVARSCDGARFEGTAFELPAAP